MVVSAGSPGRELNSSEASSVQTSLAELVEESERRGCRLELERLRAEARQEFVGVVSHELKSLVAAIKAYAELLLR